MEWVELLNTAGRSRYANLRTALMASILARLPLTECAAIRADAALRLEMLDALQRSRLYHHHHRFAGVVRCYP